MGKVNKTTVSVGMPAYNEQNNIQNSLRSTLSQKEGAFKLEKVIVISDGSNDQTCEKVTAIKNNKIHLIKGKTRKGKYTRLNQIFNISTSEILILLDADCVADEDAFNQISKLFNKDKTLGLVGTKAQPTNLNNLFTKTIYSGVCITEEVIKLMRNPENVYAYKGAMVGVKNTVYKNVTIPTTPGTDAFLFFSSLKKGLKTFYSKKAIVYYSLPTNLNSHAKQSTRFLSSQKYMQRLFGKKISSYYRIPKYVLVKSIATQLIKRPVYTFLYILVNSYIGIHHRILGSDQGALWKIADTTKVSIKNS